MTKRLLAMLLALSLLLGILPMGAGAQATQSQLLGEEDYAEADAVFAAIDSLEKVHQTKNTTQTKLTDAAQALVEASDSYVEGSLVRSADAFTWQTTDGIRCAYSPRLRQIHEDMTAPETAEPDGVYNEPVATKGGWPSGNQVYLVGPYYGYDSDFTDQYKNEAKRIASAMGDTDGYTLYSGKAATVDKVAEAVSKGAVVIFDSHGTTDYESGYDYVSGATSSYLCLTSTTGLTDRDYADGALYYSDGICINGATIANHMTANSPGGILWMAICLGMATNTMCDPLREKGVEVVCGYSQSVTFAGDYLFEEAFWDKMCDGETVATANAYMKSTWGSWDWSTKIAKYYGYTDGYSTIASARYDYAAFPVVVSDEDTHPGQRNRSTFYGADSLQTVKSTYTLFNQYTVTATSSNAAYGTVSVSGSTITAKPATGYTASGYTVTAGTATVTQNGNVFSVQASSDCTVQINFAPRQQVTVSFSGADIAPVTGYSGDAMTLPTATAPEGYTFLGWLKEPLSEDTREKPAWLTSLTPTASTTLYALYSYEEENTSTGSGDYVKVTSTPADWSGQYLIVYEAAGYIFDGSRSSFDAVSNYKTVSISNQTIPAAQGDDYSFTIAPSGSGYSIQGTSGKYIGNASNSNALTTGSTALVNKLSLSADGSANIVGTGGAYLRFNNTSGQYRFRYYKSSTYTNQKAICLYVKDGTSAIVWYTTDAAGECLHPEVVGGTCADCGLQFAARTAEGYFATVQEAAEQANGGYVQLLADAQEAVTATTLLLDLNGYLLEKLTVTKALYGYDSSATADKEGTGGILSVTGPVVTDHVAEGSRYIALQSGGSYSFHVLELTVDTLTLRTEEAGLYYGAAMACDETLMAAIASYGIALSTVDMPGVDYTEAHNLFTENTGAPTEGFDSVMVSGILQAGAEDNDRRGRMPIYANAYLTLSDGTVILSDNTNTDTKDTTGFDGVALSLFDMMTLLNQVATTLPADQLESLLGFCTAWKDTLASWKLYNLID